jgi:hypothetical protein
VVFCAKVPVFAPKILLYLTQKAHKKGGSSFPTYEKRFGGRGGETWVQLGKILELDNWET